MLSDMPSWDSSIYSKGAQFNRYPFDRVVSNVLRAKDRLCKPLTALDLGSGTGNHTKFLVENGFKTTAIESSKNAIAASKRLLAESSLDAIHHQASITSPETCIGLDERFSLILDRGSLTHNCLDDIDKALSFYSSVMHPKGSIFMSYIFSDDHPSVVGASERSPSFYSNFIQGAFKEFPLSALFLSQQQLVDLFSSHFSVMSISKLSIQDVIVSENSSAMWEIICAPSS